MCFSKIYFKRSNAYFIIIFILISISLCLIRFYSFYVPNYRTYIQNANFNSQSSSSIKAYEEIVTYIVGSNCSKMSTSVTLYNDKIIHLKSKINEFYLQAPSSVELSNRCKRFGETLVTNNSLVTPENIQSYFTDGKLIAVLKDFTILNASMFNIFRGKMLKLLFQLPNNFTAIFKPKWYRTNEILDGMFHCHGKDRHFGEVVAFYLSILLDFKNVPVAAIRKVNVAKLSLVSNQALLNTFVYKNNLTCFYGKCYCCNISDLICSDVSSTAEGSVSIHLPSVYKLATFLNPWMGRLKNDDDYCANVRNSKLFSMEKNKALFYDVIDEAIFDFLIDNGDRHTCYYNQNEGIPRLIFLDNGKRLRNSTWNSLLKLRGGNLSYWLRHLLLFDPDLVILDGHFDALDRRLLTIFTVLEDCFEREGGMKNVIFNY